MLTWIKKKICNTPPTDTERVERLAQDWGNRRKDILRKLYQEPIRSPQAAVYRAEAFRLAQCIYEICSEFDLRPLDYLK